MLEAPCKNCPKKGCGSYHDICQEYQDFRVKWESMVNNRNRIRKTEAELNSIEFDRKTRSKQRR